MTESHPGMEVLMRYVNRSYAKFALFLIAGIWLPLAAQAQRYSEWSASENLAPVIDTSPAAVCPGAPHSIAFASSRDGNNEVYVMDSDGSNQSRIPTPPNTSNDQRP